MASMPSLSPTTKTLDEELERSNAIPIPVIRRLSNVNLMAVSPETYLYVDGKLTLRNSPTATVSLQPIPTTSAECVDGVAAIPGISSSSSSSAARTRGGPVRDELFAPLAPTKNPYQVLSVLKSDPSFVAVKHEHEVVQNPNSPSRFSWIANAFECCKGKKKSFTEDDLKDFEIVSVASRTSHGGRRSRAKTQSISFKFDEDQVDLVDAEVLNEQVEPVKHLKHSESGNLAHYYGRILLTENVLIFDGEKKLRETEEEAQRAVIATQEDYQPSKGQFKSAAGSYVLQMLLSRPLVPGCFSIQSLELFNCSLSCEELIGIMFLVENLEIFKLKMTPQKYQFYRYSGAMIGLGMDTVPLSHYKKHVVECIASLTQEKQKTSLSYNKSPSRLKMVFIDLPYIKAISVTSFIIEKVFAGVALTTLEMRCSQHEMLRQLLNLTPEDRGNEDFVHELIRLHCEGLVSSSQNSLREVGLYCSDRFPLDWCSEEVLLDQNKLRLTFECKFELTRGVLYSLLPMGGILRLPNLRKLSIKLPLFKVLQPWMEGDNLLNQHGPIRQLFACFDAFITVHSSTLHELQIEGIRVEKIMIPWIKQHFCASMGKTKLGVTFYAFEFKDSIHSFFEELKSIGVIITDHGAKAMPGGKFSEAVTGGSTLGRYHGEQTIERYMPSVKKLHIVNGWHSLRSFSLATIATTFPQLSTLIIEDHHFVRKSSQVLNRSGSLPTTGSGDCKPLASSHEACITNADFKSIIKYYGKTLKYLHLDCNMLRVTDEAIIGVPEGGGRGSWKILTFSRKSVRFSFFDLTALKYLYLNGLGDKITDRFVDLCLKETVAFPNLQELHVFAPKLTEKGKESLRTNYSVRPGFILELEP